MGGADRPIIIVGGGLGGLATALALGRAGRRVRILEQTPAFGAIGYGIQLGPNVVPMFDRLGITAAVLDKGDVPDACLMVDAYSGEEIARIPLGASFLLHVSNARSQRPAAPRPKGRKRASLEAGVRGTECCYRGQGSPP